jgi:trimeric autotransporter adhesin
VLKKAFVSLVLLFGFFNGLMAQNVSYNLNLVGITGTNNTAFGFQSLPASTTGNSNSALGFQSLLANTTGSSNTAIGWKSLTANISGTQNVGVGYNTLAFNTTGKFNVAIGMNSMNQSTTSDHNTAIGHSSLKFGGFANTATGWGALSNNTGLANTGSGYAVLGNNTSGGFNTALGYGAFFTNTTGSNNTALGYAADVASAALTNATAIGNGAIVNASNSMQFGNSAVTQIYAGTGTNATVNCGGIISQNLQITGGVPGVGKVLTSNASGVATWQTPTGGGGGSWSLIGNAGTVDATNFIGTTDFVPFNIRVNNQMAGRIDATYGNVSFGYRAGINNNIFVPNNKGIQNVAIGDEALFTNQFTIANTAVGFNALYSILGSTVTAQGGNVAVGWRSLYLATAGSDNTALGTQALYNNSTSSSSTAVGKSALLNNTIGGQNTGIGSFSLRTNITGNNNTGLGYLSDVSVGSLQNATAIGYSAIVNGNDKVVIGSNSPFMVIGGYAAWSNYSDGRFKENVNENVPGLTFITKLRPVTYTINTKKLDEHVMQNMPDSIKAKNMQNKSAYLEAANKIQTGFIAQEVEKTAKEIGYNFDGVNAPKNETDNYSLAYAQFTVPLVKAVQELSKQNDDLKKEMAELRSMLTAIKSNTIEGSIKITEATTEAKLYQNAPNPFSKTTTIRYSIPATAKRVAISITTMEGIKVKTFELNSKNGEALNINGGELSAGTYIYTLVVDDVMVDSKKMILTK